MSKTFIKKICRSWLCPTLSALLWISSASGLVWQRQTCWATDWIMGRGNVEGTGATLDELPEKLELLWEVQLGGLGFDAGAIIADGKVFANDHDGRVLALDLASGTEIWRLDLEAGFVSSPAYRDRTLYVGDFDGNLRALDATTGKEKWLFATELEIDASPNFFEDTILVTSQNGTLYSLDRLKGTLNWKYETGDQLQCGATLAGDRTFLGGCDAQLHVIDVRTGLAIGQPRPLDAPTGSTPSVMAGVVYVPTYAGEIFAIKMPEGETLWRFKDPKLSDEFKNSVAVAEGLIVGAGRNKRVFALEAATGKVKWEQVLRKRADASPVISGQSVIVAAADGRIVRFDLKTGKEQWLFEVKGAFIGSPAVADGRLVLTNDRGTVFCFGEKK